MKAKPNLELIPAGDAKTEHRLSALKKNIAVCESGIIRSGAQMFGYAYIQGAALREAAELVPHGKLEKWVEQNFPTISARTATRRVEFANRIDLKSATVADLKEVKPLISSAKKLKKTDEANILKVVTEVMDGKGMMEFMRAGKFIADAKPDGGYRPNAEAVEAWLTQFHPDLAGTKYDDLPAKIQKEYRGYVPPLDPETEKETLEATWRTIERPLAEQLENKSFVSLSHERMRELRMLFHDAVKAIDEVLNKVPKKK